MQTAWLEDLIALSETRSFSRGLPCKGSTADRTADALLPELDRARISIDPSEGNWPAICAQVE